MKAGVYQSAGGGLTKDERLTCLEKHIAGQQLDLVICPELFMSGYNIDNDILNLAEASDGVFANSISALALKYETAIVYGYPEKADGVIYNSAICISAAGKLLANHRKFLPPPGFEATYFTGGSKLTLFELGGLRFAILICYDAEFPETVRAAAEKGADVIIIPTALVDQWENVARCTMPARAFENGVWVLYSNHAGVENGANYLGESCIVGPDGRDVARAGKGEQLLTAILSKNKVKAAQSRMPYLENLERLRDILSEAEKNGG